jgi:hypothetical protein
MTGDKRQLDGGTPCNLYAVPNTMRVIWVGQAARLGKTKDAYKIVVVRPKRPRTLRKLRRRLEVRVTKLIFKEDRQCTCNVIFRLVRVTTVAVEKQ